MKNELKEIDSCEVCGNLNLISVLNLGLHPMCDDLVPIGSSRLCKEYPIEIMFCENCFTAHQRFQVPKEELFPKSYHYRSRFTADVLNGMSELVQSIKYRFGKIHEKKILDIGCNDGSLLDFFKKEGAFTFGIEPTGACREAEKKGHILINNFLSEEIANLFVEEHGKPNFITFTNVFAHIENLKGVIASLKLLMAKHTIVIIENHYLGSILEGNQFDTFYHEHPRTYSYNSFVHIADSLGVNLIHVEFPSRYGGNVRVFLGNPDWAENGIFNGSQLLDEESRFQEKFEALQNNVNFWRLKRKRYLEELAQENGKLRAKAFPGRAAILIKLLGLNENIISCVYEKPGSLKIGHYLPGTRIPIFSDADLFSSTDKTKPLLNLAWHIPREIRNYITDHGYVGNIIDVLSSEDFAQK